MLPKTPPISPTAPRAVEILAYPSIQLLDVAGPLQVFAAANDCLTRAGKAPAYQVSVVASANMIAASAGLVFATSSLPPKDAPLDTLVVAGGQGVMQASGQQDLVEWVRFRATVARRVASVCTGAFMLGAAGLLDGRRAVTHWEYCAELARRFPEATVDADPIFICDAPVWTSAGVTAGIDLALALVEEDLGRAVALTVARQLVVFLKRPGGQAQFSAALILQTAGDRFDDLHAWVAENLAVELPLQRLAEKAGMSERSFSRHYRAETGMTPTRALELLRVEAARRLLIETTLPAKRIAERCGFGSEETMRRAFLRVQGTGPKEYRTRFC